MGFRTVPQRDRISFPSRLLLGAPQHLHLPSDLYKRFVKMRENVSKEFMSTSLSYEEEEKKKKLSLNNYLDESNGI